MTFLLPAATERPLAIEVRRLRPPGRTGMVLKRMSPLFRHANLLMGMTAILAETAATVALTTGLLFEECGNMPFIDAFALDNCCDTDSSWAFALFRRFVTGRSIVVV